MLSATDFPIRAIHTLFPERATSRKPSAPAPAHARRAGDTYAFGPARAPVEIVIGFRPGVDRVSVAVGTGPLLIVEENGEAVILDREKQRVVLTGVRLADMVHGDVIGIASA